METGNAFSRRLRDVTDVFDKRPAFFLGIIAGRSGLGSGVDGLVGGRGSSVEALAAAGSIANQRGNDIESVTIEADSTGHSDQFGGAPAKRRPAQVVGYMRGSELRIWKMSG
jgi:hypothetical protein